MAGDTPGWQMRLLATICSPPIPRLRFTHRSPSAARTMQEFERGACVCLGLGIVRSYLNQAALLGDFLSGGTDLFAAGLALCASLDCCMMNGSFLIMFMVWAFTNAVLFNVLLSLGPNIVHPAMYLTGPAWRTFCFVLDSVLILVNSVLQVRLAFQAWSVLDDVLPGWKHMMSGSGAPSSASAVQPLLQEPPREGASGAGTGGAFRPFHGSGQRLGSGGATAAGGIPGDPRRV